MAALVWRGRCDQRRVGGEEVGERLIEVLHGWSSNNECKGEGRGGRGMGPRRARLFFDGEEEKERYRGREEEEKRGNRKKVLYGTFVFP